MFNRVVLWLAQVWPFNYLFWRKVKLPPIEPVFVEFEDPSTLLGEYTYNPDYYATFPCAQSMMKKFGALVIFLKPIQDVDRAAPPQWYMRFSDGSEICVGQVAKYFAMYPEGDFPGAAVRFGVNYISLMKQEKNS